MSQQKAFLTFAFFLLLIGNSLQVGPNELITATGDPQTTETTKIEDEKDLGDCMCDLIEGICDKYCCCDTDCAATYISGWKNGTTNECLQERVSDTSVTSTCLSEEKVHKVNRKYNMKIYNDSDRGEDLICVQSDTEVTEGDYYRVINNQEAEVLSTLNVLSTQSNSYASALTKTPSSISLSSFDTSLKSVVTLSGTATSRDYFSFPSPSALSSLCDDLNSPKWLENTHPTACIRQLTIENCVDATVVPSYLLPATYTTDHQIARTSATTFVTITEASQVKVSVNQLPTTCTCLKEVVVGAYYRVVYDSTTQEITAATVSLTLADVGFGCGQVVLTQNFGIEFVSAATNVALPKSGAPGYLTGYPLLLGKELAEGANRVVQFYKFGFEVQGVLTTGECVLPADLPTENFYGQMVEMDKPVLKFGQDLMVGCYLSFTRAELQAYCENNNWQKLYMFYASQWVTHVGKFGTSDGRYISDWIPINKPTAPTASWDNTNSICTVVNAVNLELVSSEVGSKFNAQNEILKASFTYSTAQFQYTNSNTATKQNFLNYLAVSQYEMREDDLDEEEESSFRIIPKDFFYPISVAASGNSLQLSYSLLSASFILFLSQIW
mmetsp:Transcript_3946/g.4359  ORF Transcript_3946/g.4359 Transcript_3946/m.4359 type:complete len:611 (+) Transcript_3946:63-1895(+)